MHWHYQMTGAFDPFRTRELTLWRREQFRVMHALLLRVTLTSQVGHQLNGFSVDSPEDYLLEQLPPPYEM